MKTLEKIKDEYAKEHDYKNFNELLIEYFDDGIESIPYFLEHLERIDIIVQKECLKLASNNIRNANSWGSSMEITDEDNIIK